MTEEMRRSDEELDTERAPKEPLGWPDDNSLTFAIPNLAAPVSAAKLRDRSRRRRDGREEKADRN